MPSLADLRVIDLAQRRSESHCASLLADLGADVTRIVSQHDPRHEPDDAPSRLGRSDTDTHPEAADCGALDLADDADRAAFRDEVAAADVLVERLPDGAMARLDLGYERLRDWNPKLVYAAARDGAADATTAVAVLAAVRERDRTGRGQRIETDSHSTATADARTVGHPALFPLDRFETRDGAVVLVAVGDDHWRALCDAMGRPDLAREFPTPTSRLEYRESLRREIAAWTRGRTTEQVESALDGGAPCIRLSGPEPDTDSAPAPGAVSTAAPPPTEASASARAADGQPPTARHVVVPDGGPDSVDLSPDAAFDLLGDAHRRHALDALRTTDGAMNVEQLAAEVAASNGDGERSADEVPSDECQHVATELHHAHLPRLADAEIVAYDPGDREVELTDRIEDLEPFLQLLAGREHR